MADEGICQWNQFGNGQTRVLSVPGTFYGFWRMQAAEVANPVEIHPPNDLKIANRESGTVKAIGPDGRLSLKIDGGVTCSSIRATIRVSIAAMR